MKTSRREFIEYSTKMSAAALLSGLVGAGRASGRSGARSHPNILLLMVDQQQMPPAYGPGEGMAEGLKEVLGFQAISPGNPFTGFFPGYWRLRQNAVVLRRHYTASSACVPSRACIMTGCYNTGVDQTNGLFKSVSDVPWLDPDGTPTIGDWFRAVGYSTHYFGKWHVSDPQPPDYLEPWGFANWESSSPEPHGSEPKNLGVYRDVGFAEHLCTFLSGKANDSSGTPWFAVGSLVNPHDAGIYPTGWQLPDGYQVNGELVTGVVPWKDFPPPPPIPAQGEQSLPKQGDPDAGLVVPLNPDGFPQETWSQLPPTFGESLEDKPRCQKDYSIKMGLAFGSSQESQGTPSAYPFQFQENPTDWFIAYNQFRMYCHYLADRQLHRILQALDHFRLAENTIVVFLSDHGEMGGAHGGSIQKWHNAYEETIHVPMVISSPLVNPNAEMREILQLTSSIDVAPTLLGLAGYDENELRKIAAMHGNPHVTPFVGTDLSSHIKGETTAALRGPDGQPRVGVLFRSNDMVTEPGSMESQYQAYCQAVEDAKATEEYSFLESGSVTQPNNVRALCTGDWKIVRYVDPNGFKADEWELYCLAADPIEQTNLVDFRTGEVQYGAAVPGLSINQLKSINRQLKRELARQEALMLGQSR